MPSEPTVAIDVLLLDHVPPDAASVSSVLVPVHIADAPEIGAVAAFTDITVDVEQPAAVVYVMVAVPTLPPETRPVPEPTDAVTSAVLQEPPDVASANNAEPPTHTNDAPVIPAGVGDTVTTVVALTLPQPLVTV